MNDAAAYSYELDADGKYYFLLYGRRSRGFRPMETEAEAKRAVADSYESQRQADADEIRFNVQ